MHDFLSKNLIFWIKFKIENWDKTVIGFNMGFVL